ncbi:MAG TPA: glycosyltransferase [Caulobacteraceae bacterium]|jgi:GT2 family glycosyltransferase
MTASDESVSSQAPAAPRVSVIVPHYNDLARLGLCLDALTRQTYPADLTEIVVSDNASPCGEAALTELIAGRARLTITPTPGAGPTRNGGADIATGEIFAFTDADCVPEPQWLAEGIAALADHDFVGGAMRVLVEDAARLTPAEAFERVFAFDNAAYVARKGFSVTANLFCPRAVFEAVGGFRTGVSEDMDWCYRARAAGYRIGYAPKAIVGHPARRTWQEITTKWRRLNAEQFGLIKDRPLGRWRWLAKSALVPASALAHTPKVMASDQLGSLGQRLGALAMLYRLRLWRSADAMRILISPERP